MIAALNTSQITRLICTMGVISAENVGDCIEGSAAAVADSAAPGLWFRSENAGLELAIGVAQDFIDDPLAAFRIEPSIDQPPVERVVHVGTGQSFEVFVFLLPDEAPLA